jgi:hypothetical protein
MPDRPANAIGVAFSPRRHSPAGCAVSASQLPDRKRIIMRAETQKLSDSIELSLSLLRRHL